MDDIEHPNREKYPGWRMLAVLANGYVYAIPYVSTPDGIFLKTAFPSRRLKAYCLPDESHEEGAPEIGRYLDDEEKALVQAFETSDAPVKSGLI